MPPGRPRARVPRRPRRGRRRSRASRAASRRGAGGPERVSASVSNGGCSSSTSKPCSRPSRESARLAAAVTSGPMPCPARQATTYLRRAVISVVGLGMGVSRLVLLSLDAALGTHLWCGLGRRVRRRWARERRSPLAGENRNELDADAGRYREARVECAYGYGEAEHGFPVKRPPAGLSTPNRDRGRGRASSRWAVHVRSEWIRVRARDGRAVEVRGEARRGSAHSWRTPGAHA